MEESGKTTVFISWSGARSRALAVVLREFLENVIQSVRPYMSDKDLQAGEVWDPRLFEMIGAAKFGVACVTPENHSSAWLHFEAGALANAVSEERRLCPYLFGLRKADLRPPLARFQAKEPIETDTFALVESINALCTPPLPREKLRVVFHKFWPDFAKAIGEIPKVSAVEVATRSTDEKIDELLNIARDLTMSLPNLFTTATKARRSDEPTAGSTWDKAGG
jgi:hypothetical protein